MRLELFFKTASELQALISLVKGSGITAVNLVSTYYTYTHTRLEGGHKKEGGGGWGGG
jgi:hypothetical protein